MIKLKVSVPSHEKVALEEFPSKLSVPPFPLKVVPTFTVKVFATDMVPDGAVKFPEPWIIKLFVSNVVNAPAFQVPETVRVAEADPSPTKDVMVPIDPPL